MKKNLTELVFILDRSGSMGGLEQDTIGGFNAMLTRQKEQEGEANVTTILFDHEVQLLHDRFPLKAVAPLTEKDYYVRGCTALLDAMQHTGQPWAVSSLAQAAGLAALDETAYVEQVRALIAAQRLVLASGLRALGLRVLDGRANYLLFQGPETLGEALRQKGVVLRSCANYPGLDGSWYRTAVRTAAENEQLLQALSEVFS